MYKISSFFKLLCFIIIIVISLEDNKPKLGPKHKDYLKDGQECRTSFECPETACCRDNKCKETKHCKNQLIYIYLIVTGIAIVFLVCFVIYFVCVIKEIRKNVKQIQIANSDKAEQINQANQENERNKSE